MMRRTAINRREQSATSSLTFQCRPTENEYIIAHPDISLVARKNYVREQGRCGSAPAAPIACSTDPVVTVIPPTTCSDDQREDVGEQARSTYCSRHAVHPSEDLAVSSDTYLI